MSENKKEQQAIVPANQELTSQPCGIQINVPPIDSAELSAITQGITERTNHAIDKALAPSSMAAQNFLDNSTFQKMIDSVMNSAIPPQEKVELYKELVKMKDESDHLHADLENENIRVQADAAATIQASQGLTWDQIGEGMRIAGRIGLQAFRLWRLLKTFL